MGRNPRPPHLAVRHTRHTHCAAPHSSQPSRVEHQPPRPSRSRRAPPAIAQPRFAASFVHVWGKASAGTAGCMDDGFARPMIRRRADNVGARAVFLLRFSTQAWPLDYSDITNPAPVHDPCVYLCKSQHETLAATTSENVPQVRSSLHPSFCDGLLTILLRQYPRTSIPGHEFAGSALVRS